jgi:hypothetical protein
MKLKDMSKASLLCRVLLLGAIAVLTACDRDGKQTAPRNEGPRTSYGQNIAQGEKVKNSLEARDKHMAQEARSLLDE